MSFLSYFLGVITSPVIILLILLVLFIIKSRREDWSFQQRMKSPEKIFSHIITERSERSLGSYLDKSIAEKIKIADGRTFIFESIAVPYSDGVYLADHPECFYILVDQMLLYREENK